MAWTPTTDRDGIRARRAYAAGPAPAWPAGMPATLPAALVAAAREHPSEAVIAYDGHGVATAIPYPALLAAAQRIAQGLLDAGVQAGDIALVAVPSLADYFPALWGCLLAGTSPMTLTAPEAYAQRSAALDRLHAAWSGCQRPWILASGAAVDGLRALGDVYGDEPPRVFDLHADAAERPLEQPADGGEIALLQLSSGTTGRSRPIALTHRGVLASARDYRDASGLQSGHCAVNWLALEHSGSLLLTHVHDVVAGATNVHVPTSWVLADPLRWLDLLERHRAQHTWSPNFAYRLVASAVDDAPSRHWDLSALTSLLNGGELCTLPVIEGFLRSTVRFGVRPHHMLLAWGMAETTTALTYKRFDEVGAVRRARATPGVLLSVGPPSPGSELRVDDDAGSELPEREIGHLRVRSERVTPGHLVDGAIQPLTDPDGWLDTGDLAFVQNGEIVITGRAKDVIIVNGLNVLAHEVEEAAGDVLGVQAGSVVACALPDAVRGTEGLAVLYVPSTEAIRSELDVEIGIAVTRVVGVPPALVRALPEPELPRTSTGKVKRSQLRERLLRGDFGAVPSPHADVGKVTSALPELASAVTAAFADVVDGPIDQDRPFNELGLGSVELLKVHARLEHYLETAVPQLSLFEFPTVTTLTTHLAASRAPPVEAKARPAARGRERTAHAVAIVGIALRLPGARTPSAYWELLRAGRTAVRRIPLEELLAAGVAAEIVADPDFVPVTGSLEDVSQFAPEAFGMTVREASVTAPQQRLLLEVAHELLVGSGYESYAGETGIGVFAGTGNHLSFLNTYMLTTLYDTIDRKDPVGALQLVIGNETDFAATRIAYRLGLTGPAVSVQTACSTSLTAVHMACRSLLVGDCDIAIAGAGAVHVPHPNGYVYRKGSILSPSGSCRTFDAGADGTVCGNGVAAILLKPLMAAEADGDTIHAVIRGSAINNDGSSKVGFMAPSFQGQSVAVSRALAAAEVRADTISFVQAHGTGTAKGDPIEVQALTRAFRATTSRRGACHLGSVKPNIGHLDTCAGMAGLIAAVLALQHGEAPPQVNYDTPSPALQLEDSPFRIAREPEPLEQMGTPLRASVSAMGVGGTNVHLVLEAVA